MRLASWHSANNMKKKKNNAPEVEAYTFITKR